MRQVFRSLFFFKNLFDCFFGWRGFKTEFFKTSGFAGIDNFDDDSMRNVLGYG
jgi:hypothetical protein